MFFTPAHAQVYMGIWTPHYIKGNYSYRSLNSSKPKGSKHFCRNGVNFGWKTIIRMWQRDLERTDAKNGGQITQLPGMKERFIHRDSWTKLNVKPAKIMQVGFSVWVLNFNLLLIKQNSRIMCFRSWKATARIRS